MSTSTKKSMPTLRCSVTLYAIGSWTILHLPKSASAKLPSRGLVVVRGTVNNLPFHATLEPDGYGSHWMRLDDTLLKGAKAKAGDTVLVTMKSTKEWPEPPIPADLKKALAATPNAYEGWIETTTMARWDWIRWIRSTNNPDTRKKRIEVAMSKLKSGIRRPCCFNRNLCTEPAVSKNWLLREPQ